MYEIEFSEAVKRKAARLVGTGAVSRVRGQADLREVQGDSAAYRVRYNPEFGETGRFIWCTCSCEWADRNTSTIPGCSHALAVLSMVSAERIAIENMVVDVWKPLVIA